MSQDEHTSVPIERTLSRRDKVSLTLSFIATLIRAGSLLGAAFSFLVLAITSDSNYLTQMVVFVLVYFASTAYMVAVLRRSQRRIDAGIA